MSIPISFVDRDYRYGFHSTKHPTMVKTITSVTDTGNLSAMQIYISNSRSKAPPKFDYEDLMAAKCILEKHAEIYLVIHGCLLYNLAGNVSGPVSCEGVDPYHAALESSIVGMTAELDFAVALGRPSGVGVGVVVHPGSRKDRTAGHAEVSVSLVDMLTRKTVESGRIATLLGIKPSAVRKMRKVILENSAGEGTKLCATLEEIGGVIKGVPEPLRCQVKVCIDTAHGFGRGLYDWGADGEIERFYRDFDTHIGLEHLEVFHFNDSCESEDKKYDAPFGSRKDRHQNLGCGYVFGTPERRPKIATFMSMALEHGIPVIGEPPGEGTMDWDVIADLLHDTDRPLEYITSM